MSDGDDFVSLALESLFNLRKGGTTANWSLELSCICTIDLKAFGERIGEISMPSESACNSRSAKLPSMKHECVIALFAQIACYHVPTEGAASSHHERLGIVVTFQYFSK